MTTKKKRRPTYEELRRQLTFSEQRIGMIVRQNDELARTNLALSLRVGELMRTIEDMELANVFRGYRSRNQRQRGMH